MAKTRRPDGSGSDACQTVVDQTVSPVPSVGLSNVRRMVLSGQLSCVDGILTCVLTVWDLLPVFAMIVLDGLLRELVE